MIALPWLSFSVPTKTPILASDGLLLGMRRGHGPPAPRLWPAPPPSDVKIRLAERDQRQAADSRTEIERYLKDPPPGRSALAQRNRR